MLLLESAQGGEWASGLNRQTDRAGEWLEEFSQFRPQHPGMYRQIPWCRLFGIHRIIQVYLASRNTDWKNLHSHRVGEFHPPPVLVLFVPTERSEHDDGGHPHPSLVIHGPSHLRLSRIASSPSPEEILSPQPGLGRRATSISLPLWCRYSNYTRATTEGSYTRNPWGLLLLLTSQLMLMKCEEQIHELHFML